MFARIKRLFARATTSSRHPAPYRWNPALAPRDARVAAALMTFTNS
jgi:hypothetical protein